MSLNQSHSTVSTNFTYSPPTALSVTEKKQYTEAKNCFFIHGDSTDFHSVMLKHSYSKQHNFAAFLCLIAKLVHFLCQSDISFRMSGSTRTPEGAPIVL
jgi:hypothetical protein